MQSGANKSFTVNDMAGGCSQRSEYGHILTFLQGSGWIERCYATTNGGESNNCCLTRQLTVALPPRTTDGSSRPCYGSCAQVARGETYRKNSAIGTGRMYASRVGVKRESGNRLPPPCVATQIWNNYSLTPPSFALTNIPLVPKKSGQSGNRPLARRTDHQTARCCRCIGQSVARHPLGRTDCRYRLCLGADRESAGANCRGRQGLRRRSFRDHDRGNWRRSSDSTPIQPAHPARIRPLSLPRSQFDRALLRPTQALQAHRHALRQTRQVVLVVHSSRVRIRLVDLIENRP